MAIPRLAACAKMNTMRLVHGICARAIERLLDDGQGAEINLDQQLEILLPVIADSVGAIDGSADHDAAPPPDDDTTPEAARDTARQARPSAAAA